MREEELHLLMNGFSTGRASVQEALNDSTPEIQGYLGPALTSLDELEDSAARLVLCAHELTGWLRILNKNPTDHELGSLAELARHSAGVEISHDCEAALFLQNARRQVITEVTRVREQAVAGLLRAVVLIKDVPARIVHMRLLESEIKESLSAKLLERILIGSEHRSVEIGRQAFRRAGEAARTQRVMIGPLYALDARLRCAKPSPCGPEVHSTVGDRQAIPPW